MVWFTNVKRQRALSWRHVSTHLAPEHHRRTLPEALVWLASPVADHPLEDGVFSEHEQDTDEDADDEQQIEAGVLVEVHRRRLAL